MAIIKPTEKQLEAERRVSELIEKAKSLNALLRVPLKDGACYILTENKKEAYQLIISNEVGESLILREKKAIIKEINALSKYIELTDEEKKILK